ncbi:archaeosortase/exosortase family protein [Novosphingobium sp. M1R2S20]|uniref:Archaeosortase/exosortase family protein n=1 Tax=Novosphingobium rhizovicinum TaxID=3228928 RepID=A0ABV3R9F4_9SPHN
MSPVSPEHTRKSPQLPADPQVFAGRLLLIFGLATLVVPTLFRLAQVSWTTEAGAHGPIVLATGLWLVWYDKDRLKGGAVPPMIPGLALLLIALMFYFVGRVSGIMMAEGLSAIAVCVTTAYLFLGAKVVARFGFHIFYLCFIVSPPENWIFVGTRPIKAALSGWAVDLLGHMGLPVAQAGATIFIGFYQLQVAAACSGLYSMIGITAIGAFYIYIRHGADVGYAAIMGVLILPFAMFINFLRIIALILVTYWFGDGAAFQVSHDYGGIFTFGVAILILIGFDAALHPLVKALRRRIRERK